MNHRTSSAVTSGLMIAFAALGAPGCSGCGCDGEQDTGKISAALADKLTDALGFEGGTVVEGEPPAEHAGESAYPQVTEVLAPAALAAGQKYTVSLYSDFTKPSDVQGAVVYVEGAGKYLKVTSVLDASLLLMQLAGTIKGDSELVGKSFAIKLGLQLESGDVGNYAPWTLGVKNAGETAPTSQQLQEALSVAGGSGSVVKGNLPAGTSDTSAPQISMIVSPDSVGAGVEFGVTVFYMGGAQPLDWLYVQVENSTYYIKLPAQGEAKVEGQVTFTAKFDASKLASDQSGLAVAGRMLTLTGASKAALQTEKITLKAALLDKRGQSGTPRKKQLNFTTAQGECTGEGCDVTSIDGGTDAGRDSGFDSGTDAGHDAGTDTGTDAGHDTGPDTGDAGLDSGTDGGADGGPDAGRDAGTDAGDGGVCTPDCTGKCGGDNGCGGKCTDTCVAPETCGGGGLPEFCGVHPLPVAAGASHTCAITAQGRARCWGDNGAGQLGDGTYKVSTAPVDVQGLASGVKAISAGPGHTCAIKSDDTVVCWGTNEYGQLGTGSLSGDSPVPVPVKSLGTAKSIATGFAHSCAVTTTGAVKCWGNQWYGELGNGVDSGYYLNPVDVTGLQSGVAHVVAGEMFTCALTMPGGVKCWGYGASGRLGNNDLLNFNTPQDVAGLQNGAVALSARVANVCAVTARGGVQCWGGGLGNGLADDSKIPIPVAGLTGRVISVACGWGFSCARNGAGALKCWGYNGNGELGVGSGTGESYTAIEPVGMSTGAANLAAGEHHACAGVNTGGMKCWGMNTYGQLGKGTMAVAVEPIAVQGLTSGVANVHAQGWFTCASVNGGVKCWGESVGLQNAGYPQSCTPADIVSLTSGVLKVQTMSDGACALMTGNIVQCFGDNSYGQLGDGTNTYSAVAVRPIGLDNVIGLVTGLGHACVLTSNGAVNCWGWNAAGQLGNGTNNNANRYVTVTGLTAGVNAICANGKRTCALMQTGGVKCWGESPDGVVWNSNVPVDVTLGAMGASQLACGSMHSCAKLVDGSISCWGQNWNGSIGNGSLNPAATPPNLVSFAGTDSLGVYAGSGYTCATYSSGIKCWGTSEVGYLGDGTTRYSLSGTDVTPNYGTLKTLSIGVQPCLINSSGALYCWGDNQYCQMGNGPAEKIGWTPVDVIGF